MSPEVTHVAVGLVTLVFLVVIARCVPWTITAVIAWVASVPLLVAPLLVAHPGVLRFGVVPVALAWGLIIWLPDRSPLGPLSRAERACQQVVSAVSAGARSAYADHTLADQASMLIADLEALEPPNHLWRVVKQAQLLDLRAVPPQVGIGDATQRLVIWPWRVALDHRIVPLRLRLDDAVRARRLRGVRRPGFDDMTRAMRYDYYFLRVIAARFDDLTTREGGLRRWHDEAASLMALNAGVRPPNAAWTNLRDMLLEIQRLELTSADADLDASERERLVVLADETRRAWQTLEQRDAQGLASAW